MADVQSGPPTNIWDWLLPTWADASTVKEQQATIEAQRQSLLPYGAKLTGADMASWRATNNDVDAYIHEEPSWLDAKAQLARGDKVMADLRGWRTKLTSGNAGPPVPEYEKPQSPVPDTGAGDVVVALAFVAGLTVLGLAIAKRRKR